MPAAAAAWPRTRQVFEQRDDADDDDDDLRDLPDARFERQPLHQPQDENDHEERDQD